MKAVSHASSQFAPGESSNTQEDCQNTTKCGAAVDGTFCKYTVAHTDCLTPIPDGLDRAEAAVIMCAVRALVLSVGVAKTNRGLSVGYHCLQRASAEWYSCWLLCCNPWRGRRTRTPPYGLSVPKSQLYPSSPSIRHYYGPARYCSRLGGR